MPRHLLILDKDHNLVDVGDDIYRWGRFFDSEARRVAGTYVGPARDWYVSTVFLGVDHNYSGDGAPIVFETMVFRQGKGAPESDWTDYQERYETWGQAAAGHERICQKIIAGLGRSGGRQI